MSRILVLYGEGRQDFFHAERKRCQSESKGLVSRVAQFLAVCSSSILAETPGYVASFSSSLRDKRCVFEWHKRLLTDQLQPSTNADKLSGRSLCPPGVA